MFWCRFELIFSFIDSIILFSRDNNEMISTTQQCVTCVCRTLTTVRCRRFNAKLVEKSINSLWWKIHTKSGMGKREPWIVTHEASGANIAQFRMSIAFAVHCVRMTFLLSWICIYCIMDRFARYLRLRFSADQRRRGGVSCRFVAAFFAYFWIESN